MITSRIIACVFFSIILSACALSEELRVIRVADAKTKKIFEIDLHSASFQKTCVAGAPDSPYAKIYAGKIGETFWTVILFGRNGKNIFSYIWIDPKQYEILNTEDGWRDMQSVSAKERSAAYLSFSKEEYKTFEQCVIPPKNIVWTRYFLLRRAQR